ncbi:DUF4762 family protein [Citrobacter koseri]|uniref:DUF4762 family protein n=1 Tax=Citrobacter koseri TaxID=545 RepID=UPI000949645E|nr:DUF4762 family protein [Citrobacter koseri]HEM6801133.1 DUF4762 family protein [Citrobacter koseri]
MKKISAAEAANVIGGCCQTCTSTYEVVTTGGVPACKLVTTCTDKYGATTTTTENADPSKCGILNRAG